MAVTQAGLEGIVAAESEICFIDGDRGILSYRAINIHTLADNATFEEVIYLLWHGSLPKQSELDALKADLVRYRAIPAEVVTFLGTVSKMPPMDVLRTAVSMLGLYDPLARDNSIQASVEKAARLMAQTATIVTTFDRLRNGKPVVEGDPKLGFAANFLYTLTGKKPDDVMEHVFDIALISARRSRVECLHLRRPGNRRDAFRYSFRGDVRDWSPERPIAWRRERRSDPHAAGCWRRERSTT